MHPELTPIEDKLVLCALNCSVVALCSVHESFSEKVDDTEHYLDCASFPRKLRFETSREEPMPVLKCHGYGFVRAIDKDRRIFYVITPVAAETLSSVTVFAVGLDLQAHSVLLDMD
ncbi:NucleOLar protein family member (nol-9)-like protein, partial [Aphelenchoides avenae]